GLIFVAIGVGLVRHRIRHPEARRGFWRRIQPWFFVTFAVLWTLGAFGGTYADYAHLRSALGEGSYAVVEGVVTNFKGAPRSGHGNEEFDVGDHHYAFSDDVV